MLCIARLVLHNIIEFAPSTIDAILVRLRPKFLFAFRLRRLQIVLCTDDAIIWNKASVTVLNDSNTVWLTASFGVLDNLDRPGWLLVFFGGSARLTEPLLVQETFVSREFAKHEILVSVALVFLD